jgi:hypothetical protein
MAHGLVNAFIKNAQIDIQKCITWPKKSEKGKQALEQACINSQLKPKKFKHAYEDQVCFLPLFFCTLFVQFLCFFFIHYVFSFVFKFSYCLAS